MNRMLKVVVIFLLGMSVMPTWAESTLSLGVVLNGTGWSGDNGSASSDFDSDKGGQFGLSASLAKGRYYFGLSLQGGDYQFDSTGPTEFTSAGAIPTRDVKVTHTDFDLLAGYYFWDKVSLFVDLKSVGSAWRNNDYDQSFSGLGLGIAGYQPINDLWTFFASWGFVGGDIKEGSSREIGEATSNALILGANYALDKNNFINMGVKFRGYLFDYDDGNEQEYNLNGLFFGYNHVFEL